MGIIEKRLNDSGKNWRHVSKVGRQSILSDILILKALTLLDYLVQCGSEKVTTFAQKNLYLIRTLKEFQYIDDEGADRGASIREKSKQLTDLLTDDERLAEAKKTRQELRMKLQANTSFSHADGYGSYQHRISASSDRDEQSQLERAIEESKRTAEEHERRMKQAQEDEQLRKAIEASKIEYENEKTKSEHNSNDLISLSFDGGGDQYLQQQQQQQQVSYDPFGPSGVHGAGQPYHPPPQPADPFSMMSNQNPFMQLNPPLSHNSNSNNIDPFYTAPAGGYAPPPREQMQIGYAANGSNYNNDKNSSLDPPQYFSLPLNQGQITRQASSNNNDPFGLQRESSRQIQASHDPFGSHYDQGSAQRNLVPKHVQNTNDPNSQLASIVRNSSEIDPFANIANERALQSRPTTGGPSMANYNYGINAPSQASFEGYQPQYQPNDPFAMNSNPGYSYGGMSNNAGFSSNNSGAQPGSQKSAYYHASNQGNQSRQGAPANDPFASLVSFPAKQSSSQPTMTNNRNTPLNSFPSSGRF